MSKEKELKKRRKQLLEWYDTHHRSLPWRSPPGTPPPPAYHVWLSEIMLQQTVVKVVIPYFLKFIRQWPRIEDLASAPLDDVLTAWAGLGYYARARNLHKCANTVTQDYDGKFPQSPEQLQKLPGIGPYTAAAIASIAFNVPAAAVDGNVERVLTRYYAITTPIRNNKKQLKTYAEQLAHVDDKNAGDLTQALMELGATLCTPTKPDCPSCPWQQTCMAHQTGVAADLPKRAPKQIKPERYGTAFFLTAEKSGKLLLQKRPENGLLGGMVEFPSTPWQDAAYKKEQDILSHFPLPDHIPAVFKKLPGRVTHHFTHFTLHLTVWAGSVPEKGLSAPLFWAAQEDLHKYALPSIMKKLHNHTLKENKSFL
ncbi:MAG: A/G-specific adenine glycosylase [Alphaproteobacteria bacterium]|nr:MAG: A/G-specific adenine glycosylase [Alphaproteobacteria bacterium]